MLSIFSDSIFHKLPNFDTLYIEGDVSNVGEGRQKVKGEEYEDTLRGVALPRIREIVEQVLSNRKDLSQEDKEDILQEICLQLFIQKDIPIDIENWIRETARIMANKLACQKRDYVSLEDIEPYRLNSEVDIEAEIEKEELIRTVQEVIAELSEIEQKILLLRYKEKLIFRKIACRLHRKKSTVIKIHNKIIQKLRADKRLQDLLRGGHG